jgi:hypothetical protein
VEITHLEIPIPAEYLPSGDHAMIVAWTTTGSISDPIRVVLCTENGMPLTARLDQIRFEWRYDNDHQKWVDVSGIPMNEGDERDDTDQEPSGDGGEGVPGRLSEIDGAGEGDSGESGDQGVGGVDSSKGVSGSQANRKSGT